MVIVRVRLGLGLELWLGLGYLLLADNDIAWRSYTAVRYTECSYVMHALLLRVTLQCGFMRQVSVYLVDKRRKL